jgi:TRAP-type C4-dicarboxylate transport system substrate-binding protein
MSKGGKMNKRPWIILVATLVILAALLLPACTPPATPPPTTTPPTTTTPPAPPPAPKTLKASYTMPKGRPGIPHLFEWWGPEFEKQTDGRYKVELYPASTLIPIPAILDSVKKNVAQISLFVLGISPGFPLTMITGIPGLAIPLTSAEASLAANQSLWDFYNIPEVNKEWTGIQLIAAIQLDNIILASKSKEVHVPLDFKGMKVGGSGYVMEEVTVNGGAAVVQMPPETYMNLDKGVVDAAFVNYTQVSDYKLQEIVNYFYNVNFGAGWFPIIANNETYNAMSAQDKEIFKKLWLEGTKIIAPEFVDSRNTGIKAIKDKGKVITEPTAAEQAEWNKASDLAYAKWKADCKAAGVDEATANKIMAGWLDIVKKYKK